MKYYDLLMSGDFFFVVLFVFVVLIAYANIHYLAKNYLSSFKEFTLAIKCYIIETFLFSFVLRAILILLGKYSLIGDILAILVSYITIFFAYLNIFANASKFYQNTKIA